MHDANGSRPGHLLFVWSPTGYELHERDGEPPGVGTTFEDGEHTLRVSKVGPSPLPGDRRPCAFTELA